MYKKKSSGWAKHFDFIVLDLLCLHLSFTLAYILRHGIANPYGDQLYRNMAIFITFADITVLFFFETLKGVLKRGYYKEFAATLKHTMIVFLLSVLYLFSIQESFNYSRVTMFLTGIIYLLTSYLVRIWRKHTIFHSRRAEHRKRSMLIITTSDIAEEVTRQLLLNNYEQLNISGIAVIDCNMVGASFEKIPVVADKNDVINYVCHEWIDEIFAAFSRNFPYPQDLIDQCTVMGITVHEKLNINADILGKKQLVEKIGDYTVLTTSINYATTLQTFAKRALDIVGGLLGCIATGILFLFLAPVIYFSSPGPVIFSQYRVGKNGKKFKIYKFRTMYMDAEERKKELMENNRVKDGMMFKLDFDPRIIGNKVMPDGTLKFGIGSKIRALSLDEFPQFLNVLKGDMSLVGTRPPTLDEWEKYELHHRARLAIKPGITGMWQVSGRSNITDFEEVVKLDTKYISEWNLGLDLKILCKTIGVVFKKEGSM